MTKNMVFFWLLSQNLKSSLQPHSTFTGRNFSCLVATSYQKRGLALPSNIINSKSKQEYHLTTAEVFCEENRKSILSHFSRISQAQKC